MTPERFADVARVVAAEAGAIALGGFRRPMRVTEKGANDLVTDLDLAAEQHIRRRLAELTPEIAVVGEEQGGQASGELVWYCDPIDGTTNYVHGHPFWSVAIGLVRGTTPIAGAVVAPAIATSWWGWSGGPALRNGEPCRPSSTQDLDHALLATGFPRERSVEPDGNLATFVRMKLRCQGVRRCGSAAIDLCMVADGSYDGYWERKLSAWDLAAGSAVVLSAGGRLSHLNGGTPTLAEGNIVASNGVLHDSLLAALADSP